MTHKARRKKVKPMKQVIMASPKEVANIAYVPVTNAMTIAPMEVMVEIKAVTNKSISAFPPTSKDKTK